MILWLLGYLPAHLLVYIVVLRRLALFRREGPMLLFHALPAAVAAASALVLAVAAPGPSTLCQAVIVISMQGIYSLSFLELWSLTQAGYSLTILSCFCAAGGVSSGHDLAPLQQLGASKRANRLAGLLRLHLIRSQGDRVRLTRGGRVVAALLWCLARTVNLKGLG
jgi:hypothetical protein